MPWSPQELKGNQEYGASLSLTEDVIRKIQEVDQQSSTLTHKGISGFSARVLDTTEEKADPHLRSKPAIVELVEIIKKPGQSLGLYLREGNGIDRIAGVFASRFGENSELERYGAVIRPGDEILSINNVEVASMSIDDVVLILSIPRRLLLRIRYLKHQRDKLSISSSLRPSRPVVVFQKNTYDKTFEPSSTRSGGVLNQLTTTANTWLGKRARQQFQNQQQTVQRISSNSKALYDEPDQVYYKQEQTRNSGALENAFNKIAIKNLPAGPSSSRTTSKIRRAESFTSTVPNNRNGPMYTGFSMPRSQTSANSSCILSTHKSDGRFHGDLTHQRGFLNRPDATTSHHDHSAQEPYGVRSNSLPRRKTNHAASARTVKWRNDVTGGVSNHIYCGADSESAHSAPEIQSPTLRRAERRTVDDIFSAQEYRNWAGTSYYMGSKLNNLDRRQSRLPLRCGSHSSSCEIRSSSLPSRVALSTISQLGLNLCRQPHDDTQSAILPYRRPVASKMLDRLHVSPLVNRRTPLRSAGPGFDVDKFRDNRLTGILTVQIVAGRNLKIPDKQKGQTTEMYCVLEINEIHRARTGVSTPDRNYRWGETFNIDIFEATQAQFFVYSWHQRFRHQLCHKGMLKLVEVFLVGEQNEEWNFSLNLEPKGQLIIRIGFKNSATVFKRTMSSRHDSVFGNPLSRIVEHDSTSVPIILMRLIQEIEERGVDSAGLYILCGSVEKKRALRSELQSLYNGVHSVDLGFEAVADTNVLACVLKDFFRELPEPLVPLPIYRMMADALTVVIPTDMEGNRKLFLKIVDCLPTANKHTLILLMDHLKNVLSSEPYNGITLGRLATIFAPLIFCSQDCEAKQHSAVTAVTRPPITDNMDIAQAISVFQLFLEIWPGRVSTQTAAQNRDVTVISRPQRLRHRNHSVD
uniref:Rho GTPase-activating protein syd-1 n=1 Tax=Steinernema glaseri TaxID=37863 RepID=A0A1I8AU21_9BILA